MGCRCRRDASRIPCKQWETDQAWAYASRVTAGDFDGDGVSDLVGASSTWDGSTKELGAAWAFDGASGPAGSPDTTLLGDQARGLFGASLSAGDLDGDGLEDLVVGQTSWSGAFSAEGQVLVFPGTAAGPSAPSAWAFSAGQDNARTGWSVSARVDANGDGLPELLVSAPYYDDGSTNEGVVWWFDFGA